MPLEFFPIALFVAIIVTFGAMIYLLLHLRAVAELFRGAGQITPGPGRHTSRRAIILALVLFTLGGMSSIAIWWTAWSGEANEADAANDAPSPYLMR